MSPTRLALERRVLSALEAAPSRIPIILGGCGTGRTFLLQRLRERLGRTSCQYVDIERTATTPERFLRAVTAPSPFKWHEAGRAAASARDAFDATLAFLDTARVGGDAPATFMLDEVLELRTFESFPGLRAVLRDLLDALAGSGNRFVLATRYVARAHRLLREASARFEVMHTAPLAAEEVTGMMPPLAGRFAAPAEERDEIARAVHVLADGRPKYVKAIGDAMAAMAEAGAADPVSALASLLGSDGALHAFCCFRYELRLHRARGYGALKAILEILAEEEPLTLTEISHRLQRTPGSTKDYLSWLEDVDLVTARQKRYSFTDPLLRVWVRLHCRPVPPTDEDVAREVQIYAAARLPRSEPALALAGGGGGGPTEEERKQWGIIEID